MKIEVKKAGIASDKSSQSTLLRLESIITPTIWDRRCGVTRERLISTGLKKLEMAKFWHKPQELSKPVRPPAPIPAAEIQRKVVHLEVPAMAPIIV